MIVSVAYTFLQKLFSTTDTILEALILINNNFPLVFLILVLTITTHQVIYYAYELKI